MNKRRKRIYGGLVLLVIGLLVFFTDFLNREKLASYNRLNTDLFTLKEERKEKKEEVVIVNKHEEIKQEVKSIDKEPLYSYIGTLEIPSINFKRGFTSIASPGNSLNQNIVLVKGSTMPNRPRANLILAGHSGRGAIAFFTNLYKIKDNDLAIVNYGGSTYKYALKKKYFQKKKKVGIFKDPSKSTLTLITCRENVNDEQTVYIFELIN